MTAGTGEPRSSGTAGTVVIVLLAVLAVLLAFIGGAAAANAAAGKPLFDSIPVLSLLRVDFSPCEGVPPVIGI